MVARWGNQRGRSRQPAIEHQHQVSTFGIAPGYEMHFDGMDNLSPYIAFELPITLENVGYRKNFWGQDINDCGQPDQYVVLELGLTSKGSPGRLNILFGADYYFSDAIYLGFEAGLGFSSTSLW